MAHDFPPIGGAGAQRPASLVRNLPRYGYEPVVITATGPLDSRWKPRDTTLVNGESGAEIHRVAGPEPLPSEGRRARLERLLRIRSEWSRWWVAGALELGLSSTHGDAEVVYAWAQPYECAVVGAALGHKLKRPWIADLGDPWALDEMMLYPTGLHRRLEVRRMESVLESASAIVMSTPEAATRLIEAFPLFASKPVIASPVGYEGADFGGEGVQRDDSAFRIVHTGYLHTADGLRLRQAGRARRLLGGAYADVDILTRSHVFLLEALEKLVETEPGLASVIEVHLVGVLSDADHAVADRSPLVRTYGYVPHLETVRLMRSADLLFLPMQNLPAGVRAGLVPGKTYEYLASGRPILAAVPDGDAKDLLIEAGNASICAPADVAAIAKTIAEHVARWRRGERAPTPRPEVVARYERANQAQQLAQLFDGVLGRPSADV